MPLHDSSLLIDGPKKARHTFVLAHGAGAPMDSPFMQFFAERLSDAGLRVVRFEFPYMADRRRSAKMRPPDREPVLRQRWQEVIEHFSSSLIIGGKSLGGRIASLIADESGVAGLICLGYPFHPTGQSDRLRIAHLQHIQTPTLILQGVRDPFGTQQEVIHYLLSPAIRFHWLEDGDHSFKPRKASGRSEQENWREGIQAIVEFARALP